MTTISLFPSKELATAVKDALETLKQVAKTLCDRQGSYGDPRECFGDITRMWNLMGFRVKDRLLTPSDVALAMITLKICRQLAASSHDNWVDIAGYATLAAALEKSDGSEEIPDPKTSA